MTTRKERKLAQAKAKEAQLKKRAADKRGLRASRLRDLESVSGPREREISQLKARLKALPEDDARRNYLKAELDRQVFVHGQESEERKRLASELGPSASGGAD